MPETIDYTSTIAEDARNRVAEHMRIVNGLRVRGLPADDASHETLRLQRHYSTLVGRSDDDIQAHHDQLADYLQSDLPDYVYTNWVTHYKNLARQAYDAGDDTLQRRETNNATDVLRTLANKNHWTTAEFNAKQADMLADIGSIKPARTEQARQSRFKRLASAVSGAALGAYVSATTGRQPAPHTSTQPENIEPSVDKDSEQETKKRRTGVLIGVAAVSAVLVGTAIEGYLMTQGHGGISMRDMQSHLPFGFGSHHSGNGNTLNDAHEHVTHGATSAPAPTPSAQSSAPAPSTSHSGLPQPSPHTSRSGGQPGGRSGGHGIHHKARQHVQIIHERLRESGDTIWQHVRESLGKNATDKQVNSKVIIDLRLNHLSFAQARHLRVGFPFLMKK